MSCVPLFPVLEQWVKAGRVGNWFNPLGQAPELGGISRGMRLPMGFHAVQDISVLRSTALPIFDTWTLGRNYRIFTPGGGVQYLIPDHHGMLVLVWGYY
jgi:hypothetical protein